jgi:hypothetical protein
MRAAFALPVLALPALADGYGFMTPSANIYCNGSLAGGPGGTSEITCFLVETSGPPPAPKPAGCRGVWGQAFALAARGRAEMLCLDRPPQRANYTDIAPYGVSAEFGDITCRSESTGLTCRNTTGNGFALSRRQQRLF